METFEVFLGCLWLEQMGTLLNSHSLLELSNQLREYEQKYDLSSTEFYRQYQAGLLSEPLQHCVEWAAIYDLFMRTKRMLEATLMRAAIYPELEGVRV